MVKKSKDYIFVIIQLCFFLSYLQKVNMFYFKLPLLIKELGLFFCFIAFIIITVSLIQLNKNLSPFPSPKSGSKLITNGLYKYIRHPIYTGILFFAVGYALYINSFYKILISIFLGVLFYFKSKYEETKLIEFHKDYPIYKTTTGRFLPNFCKNRV